jgi:hypothetical protein
MNKLARRGANKKLKWQKMREDFSPNSAPAIRLKSYPKDSTSLRYYATPRLKKEFVFPRCGNFD